MSYLLLSLHILIFGNIAKYVAAKVKVRLVGMILVLSVPDL